jgi:hypothetical protein
MGVGGGGAGGEGVGEAEAGRFEHGGRVVEALVGEDGGGVEAVGAGVAHHGVAQALELGVDGGIEGVVAAEEVDGAAGGQSSLDLGLHAGVEAVRGCEQQRTVLGDGERGAGEGVGEAVAAGQHDRTGGP